MALADRTAYYTLVATILLGVVLGAAVQLRDISRAIRDGHASLVQRAVLLLYIVVAAASVAALAEMPKVLRGGKSWLNYSMAESLVSVLLGLSVASPILAAGAALFRRRSSTPKHLDASAQPQGPERRAWRWLALLLLLVGRRRR